MGRLKVKVTPGSRQTRVTGWMEDCLKVRVQAPPEKGKANQAVAALLARELGCARADVRVAAGETARLKTVEVSGWSDAALRDAIGRS